jgi:phage-related protein
VPSIKDLIIRVLGDGSSFRQDMDENRDKVLETAAELDAVKAEPEVDVKGIDKTNTLLEEIKAELHDLNGQTATVRVNTEGVANAEQRFQALKSAILTTLPLVSPLAAVGTGAMMGLASAYSAAGIGVAGFAAVAQSSLSNVFDANKKLTQAQEEYNQAVTDKQRQAALQKEQQVWNSLDATQKKELQTLRQFSSFWQNYTKSFSQPIGQLWVNGLKMLQQVLTDLKPVFQQVAVAASILERNMNQFLKGDTWKQFVSFLNGNVLISVLNFGQSIGNVFAGLMALMSDFSGLGADMTTGLVNLTERFKEWAETVGQTQGFKNFVEYVRTEGPQVLQLIRQLASIVSKLLVAMAPSGALLLQVVNGLAQMINHLLSLNPLVGQFAVAIMQGIGVVKLISGGLGIASNALKLFGVQTSLALGPWGILIAAIAAGAVLVVTHWQQISSWAQRVWSDVKAAWNGLMSDLSGIWHSISGTASSVFNGLTSFFQKWGTTLLAVFVPVIGLPLLIAQHWQQITSFASQIWGDVVSTVKSIWNSFTSWISNAAQTLVDGVVDAFKWLYNHNYYFADLVNAVRNAWNTLRSATTSAWNTIRSSLSSVWSGIRSTASSASSAVRNTVSSAWSRVRSTTTSAWNSVRSSLSSAWSRIRSGASSTLSPVASTVSSIWSRVRSNTSSAWSSITSAARSGASRVLSAVRSPFSSLGSYFSSLASRAWSWGRNLISMFGQGIRSEAQAIENAVESIANRIESFLGFHSPAKEGPGAEADTWAPNLMKMFVQGIQQYTPQVQAALANAITPPQVSVSPQVSSMIRGVTQTAVASAAAAAAASQQTVHFNAPLVNIAQANVRSDQDITKLAQQIQRMQRQKLRAVGVQV